MEAVSADELALQQEKAFLAELEQKPLPARLKGYFKLSGPGWLQSAMTLGGGSLTSSLYLGVLAGFSMLWLQPLAMVLGIIMLSAIGWVTLTTGERPFRAINQHVNPVLGWGWLIASMLANMVWSLPQYSLATGVIQQNLLPSVFGSEGMFSDVVSKGIIVGIILLISIAVTWSYGSGNWGVRLYEKLLKIVVALIVACFVAVVLRIGMDSNGFAWGEIFAGLVPDFGAIFRPADGFMPFLDRIAEGPREYWTTFLVDKQRDVLMSAFATAVGINMTFMLPYTMLGRSWGREHRTLSIVDLCCGMFIPFMLATSCVVVASASQFHTTPQPGLVATGEVVSEADQPSGKQIKEFERMLADRVKATGGELSDVSDAEKLLAATLVTRDVRSLSGSLTPLFGRLYADIIFGLGVLAMALSTITLLMLVSGFVVCEVMERPSTGWTHRLGALFATTGALGPFFWKEAAAWLAVPTSVFGLVLLPMAYLTFFLLINQRSLLGDQMPSGKVRVMTNLLMGIAASVALFASGWAIWANTGYKGIIGAGLFLLLALVVHFVRKPKPIGTGAEV